ncbi:MAG: methyltransferase domain-containing protein [Solirubrobacterales bacterium]|jgi:SAM-dependent methyltransferase|nr:methyltransferase domain-containing protein [Solirubrobacterales bacterium]
MRDWYEQVWESALPDPEPWAWQRRRARLLDEAKPGERVLDLGCGAGRFLRALQEVGSVPVGVEIAEAALSRARVNAPRAELHLMAPDAELPLADDSIALVWCSEVIEHVADTAQLVGEVHRVLAPGGRVLITTPFHGRLHGAAVALLKFDSHFDPLGQHLRFYTRTSLAKALSEGGLTDVRVRATGGVPLLRRTLVARARKR